VKKVYFGKGIINNMKKIAAIILLVLLPLLAEAQFFAKWTMTPEDLISQLKAAEPVYKRIASRQNFSIASSITHVDDEYKVNGIRKLHCRDKQGHDTVLDMNPNITARIIDKRGKIHFFYFDTMILEDSVIRGYKIRFTSTIRTINIGDIEAVKIQNKVNEYHYE
jgi:hypothetical protein